MKCGRGRGGRERERERERSTPPFSSSPPSFSLLLFVSQCTRFLLSVQRKHHQPETSRTTKLDRTINLKICSLLVLQTLRELFYRVNYSHRYFSQPVKKNVFQFLPVPMFSSTFVVQPSKESVIQK